MTEEQRDQIVGEKVVLGKHQFLIEATDEEGRQGRWIVHRPNAAENGLIAVKWNFAKTLPARAGEPGVPLEPIAIDESHDTLLFLIATLDVVCDARPEWFPRSFGETCDLKLVFDLGEKYQEWINSFRDRLRNESGTDRGTPPA